MFKKTLIGAAVVLTGIYFLATTPAQNQDGARQATSWRHLALTAKEKEMDEAELARQINQLGRDGWELVDVETYDSAGETEKTVYFFKRPG